MLVQSAQFGRDHCHAAGRTNRRALVVHATKYEETAREPTAATPRWQTPPIASFLIVHGGWGGGWEWAGVARVLRGRGHDVFTPTLTGMGERSHLGHREVGLDTHVEDILGVLGFEDLHDVVLCGASYGGMPVTGAADRVPHKIGVVVYIDALVPEHGQSALDLAPAGFSDALRASADARGEGWRVPVPNAVLPATDCVSEENRARYLARLRNQPLRTLTDTIQLSGAIDTVPRAFIRCTGCTLADALGGDPIAPAAARARREGWLYREFAAPHDPQLTDPIGIAAVLHDLSAVILAR
jgi:pimeloyl-ACP methyl ester carboxylesterase